MGFSCSPMWCSLYFMAYKIHFISRLILLRHFDLLDIFEQAYRYIDDIYILNALCMDRFLDQEQDRTPNNPWWIYPLHLVEIKLEMTITRPEHPDWGTNAHFLSMRIVIMDIDLGFFKTKNMTRGEHFCSGSSSKFGSHLTEL